MALKDLYLSPPKVPNYVNDTRGKVAIAVLNIGTILHLPGLARVQ